jgi:hypothetical protein
MYVPCLGVYMFDLVFVTLNRLNHLASTSFSSSGLLPSSLHKVIIQILASVMFHTKEMAAFLKLLGRVVHVVATFR